MHGVNFFSAGEPDFCEGFEFKIFMPNVTQSSVNRVDS